MDEKTISSDQAVSVYLTEFDIPGAFLSEPMASHTVPQLTWWLLCRGIKVPTSWKKQKLLFRLVSLSAKPIAHCHHDANFNCFRIEQAKSKQLPLVDVDGSYLYRKQQTITQSGIAVAPLPPPSPPLSGWEVVTDGNVQTMASKIPVVASGTGIVHTTFMAIYTCIHVYMYILLPPAFRDTIFPLGLWHWPQGNARCIQSPVTRIHPLGIRKVGSVASEHSSSSVLSCPWHYNTIHEAWHLQSVSFTCPRRQGCQCRDCKL